MSWPCGTSVCIRGALAWLGSWHIVRDLVISSMFLFRFLQNTDVRALSLVFSVPWWLSYSLDISLQGLWDDNSVALEDQAVFDGQFFTINLVGSYQWGQLPYCDGPAIVHNFLKGRKLQVFRCFCRDLLKTLACGHRILLHVTVTVTVCMVDAWSLQPRVCRDQGFQLDSLQRFVVVFCNKPSAIWVGVETLASI